MADRVPAWTKVKSGLTIQTSVLELQQTVLHNKAQHFAQCTEIDRWVVSQISSNESH